MEKTFTSLFKDSSNVSMPFYTINGLVLIYTHNILISLLLLLLHFHNNATFVPNIIYAGKTGSTNWATKKKRHQ